MKLTIIKMNENKYGIVPFNGSNFDNWKFRLMSVLRADDVIDVIKETEEENKTNADWIKKDSKARNIIIQSVTDSHLEYIKDIENAHEMLKKLERTFAKKGTCSKFYLLKEIVNLKYSVQEDLQQHFSKYDKIFRELKALGASFSESDIACFLLLSMPVEYENVVTAIRTMSEDDLDLYVVKKRLLEFKNTKNNATRGKFNSVPASFVSTKGSIKCYKCGKLGHMQKMCGIKCFVCNKFGHKAETCRNGRKSKETVQANYSKDQEDVAFCSTQRINVQDTEDNCVWWYADSGATHHYINDEKVLTNKKYFKEPKPIQLAEKGKCMYATCCGDVKVMSEVKNENFSITIKDVFCVPELRLNLLSNSCIEKVGFQIMCADGCISIRRGNNIYAVGKRNNNLYGLKFRLARNIGGANLSSVDLNNE